MIRQHSKLRPPTYPNSPDWDFSRYQANAVVINLGTNDARSRVSNSAFQSTYVTFLQEIRAKYPKAFIFALRPFRGYKAAQIQAAVQAVNEAGDANVQYVDTTNWLSLADYNRDHVHPTDAGQVRVANLLEPIIAAKLKISPSGPSSS